MKFYNILHHEDFFFVDFSSSADIVVFPPTAGFFVVFFVDGFAASSANRIFTSLANFINASSTLILFSADVSTNGILNSLAKDSPSS
jgi:hypothetical protein